MTFFPHLFFFCVLPALAGAWCVYIGTCIWTDIKDRYSAYPIESYVLASGYVVLGLTFTSVAGLKLGRLISETFVT